MVKEISPYNVPNFLSLSRILLVPIFGWLLMKEQTHEIVAGLRPGQWGGIVVAFAGITDLIDGWYARKFAQVTIIGKFLDPIADKLFLLVGLVMLQECERVAPWLVIILLSREILITGFRAIIASKGIVISAGKFGKLKLIFQLVGIGFLSWHVPVFMIDSQYMGLIILYLALAFSLISAYRYVTKSLKAVAT